ncbi:MAG: M43 family zinc metalloprotease [Saprospiraceae bacterium]|nr:M43 family zinc metalloprotease [Saprospiraceae bacterium]
MTRLLFALSFFWMATTNVHSQTRPILCGNELFSDIIRKNYPALQESFDNTFETALVATPHRGQDPLLVNVVVHIVWKEEAENLDESIILDQLRILNEDFNQLNADQMNLRSQFQPEAGSAGISFHLAQIIRVQTEAEFAVDILGANLLPEVKSDILGGSTAWDPGQFLNIWVCKIQPIEIFGIEIGQILGFAFPPNNLANWPVNSGAPDAFEDGVVIDFRVVGSNNPNTLDIPGGGGQLPVKGRTPVHEVGHYFGLRHIWGDGGTFGPNDCAQSDGINDTPFANAQSSFDCDTTKNTCTQVELHYGEDIPDLVENYMDYASEECMNMFTKGQVELMRNVLEGPRSGLLMPFSAVTQAVQQFSFDLVPNPSDDYFAVELEIKETFTGTLRIVDANGRRMWTNAPERFLPGRHRIAFDELALTPGMYFLEIRSEKGVLAKKLIVY